MKHILTICTLGLLLACSEAADPVEDDASVGGTTSTGGMGTGATGNTGGTTSTGGSPAGVLVINELSASGDDFVELFNGGMTPIDTAGLRVADDDNGAPKLDEAVDISGRTVMPNEYVFILVGLDTMAMPGEQTDCGPGPSPCFQGAFGISNGSGDTIYLVDGADAVLTSVAIPGNAVADGQTYSRIPNGTGDFAAGTPTPGAENMPAR